MLKHRTNYDDEFKKNAVKMGYVSPESVRALEDDLDITENLLRN